MPSHAEQSVPFETVLLFINPRKVIPYSPQVRESRFAKQTQKLLIRSFGRMVQGCAWVLERRDGTEQQIAADRGGSLAVLVQTNGLIAAPDLASAGTFQDGEIKVNDRALKGQGLGRAKRHDGERERARCGEPSAQVGRFHTRDFDLACRVEDTLSGCGGRGTVTVSDAHSCALTSF